MYSLSLNIPEFLVKKSDTFANKIGISRMEFFRRAIQHEIESLQTRWEQEAMAKSFKAMRKHPSYLEDVERLDQGFSETLPEEKDAWWSGRDA